MADGTKLERALAAAADDIAAEGKRFALVGGLAVSVRAEVRFTRDVDLAVAVDNDTEAESLVYALKSRGYTTVASVEHEAQSRLATIRLRSPQGVKVDLLFASSGIEAETIARAQLARLECRAKPMRDGDHALLGRYDSLFGASRVAVHDVSAKVIDRATELRARHGFKSPDAIPGDGARMRGGGVLDGGCCVVAVH